MNFGNLLKEAEKAKKRFKETQEKLTTILVETSAGGGMVKITCNAAGDFLSLKINPSLVDPNDVESLEDVILAAIKQATEDVRNAAEQEMSKVASGLKIPGLPGF
jgi:DNA-binding YbaB/EbfC family protein